MFEEKATVLLPESMGVPNLVLIAQVVFLLERGHTRTHEDAADRCTKR